jgi:tRNA U34 2-thiouridine synthase MnmA/TrmU
MKFVHSPPREVIVQTRAHSAPVAAFLEGDTVVFDTPQSRVAPGQVVACYDGDVLLGGGLAAA